MPHATPTGVVTASMGLAMRKAPVRRMGAAKVFEPPARRQAHRGAGPG
jgi:hypothetical protein